MFSKVSAISVLVLGVYLSSSLNGVSATIMCYNCTSFNNNTACADPVNTSAIQMTTCPDNYYCTKVKYSTQGYNVVSRNCDPASNDTCGSIQRTLNYSYTDLSNFYCSTCNVDHCNSAVTFGIPLVAMLLAFLAIKLI